MNEIEQAQRTRAPLVRVAAHVFPMTFVIIVVNLWIYYARYLYIARYPIETSATPPTISRAISDPVIGQPFARWISVSAVLLFVATSMIARLQWRMARTLQPESARTRRTMQRGSVGMVVFQALTSLGMLILANFPLAQARDAHMFGSYVFFISQAVSALIVTIVTVRIARDGSCRTVLWRVHGVGPAVVRTRIALGSLSVFLSLSFLVLFVAKDFPLPHHDAVQQIYVLSEPSLITTFLFLLSTFYVDVLASLGFVIASSAVGPAEQL